MRNRWLTFWRAQGVVRDTADAYAELQTAYTAPDRHYHNLRHIQECLALFDTLRADACNPAAVEMALWFHDAVYDPARHDNEEQSAAWARRVLTDFGLLAPQTAVETLILATKHHAVPSDADAQLIVDIDLSILGQTEARFEEYEADIRKEYAAVPDDLFRAGRAKVLRRFVERPTIYMTEACRARFEAPARANLARSLQKLETGTV